MAKVGSVCIDRWEIATVDHATGQALSPYYHPAPRPLRFAYEYWVAEAPRTGDRYARSMPIPMVPPVQRAGNFEPRAVSSAGVVPQGYLSYFAAKRACENAGKRLCTEDEWVRACRGAAGNKHGYAQNYERGRCNIERQHHPAVTLHGNSSVGHLDPRLNLVVEEGRDPLLHLTGESAKCSVRWDDRQVFDMVGNLDEWIDDPNGVFVGGFYARGTRQGCEAKISNHAPGYYDYSLGTRCCRAAD